MCKTTPASTGQPRGTTWLPVMYTPHIAGYWESPMVSVMLDEMEGPLTWDHHLVGWWWN